MRNTPARPSWLHHRRSANPTDRCTCASRRARRSRSLRAPTPSGRPLSQIVLPTYNLFAQAGAEHDPITTDDILAPSEMMKSGMDYDSATVHGRALAEKLAATNPRVLACMHGASFQGDGAKLLRALDEVLG